MLAASADCHYSLLVRYSQETGPEEPFFTGHLSTNSLDRSLLNMDLKHFRLTVDEFRANFAFSGGIGILNLCLTLPTFAFTFDELSEVESNPWLKGSGCSSSIMIKFCQTYKMREKIDSMII